MKEKERKMMIIIELSEFYAKHFQLMCYRMGANIQKTKPPDFHICTLGAWDTMRARFSLNYCIFILFSGRERACHRLIQHSCDRGNEKERENIKNNIVGARGSANICG